MARMGWNRGGIGIDGSGRCKVSLEQADMLVSKYAKSDIIEG